jgi:lipopolysaccharide biosynthesis glycosyltransferase
VKNNLLVTLADENFVDQAKQLFSSVYYNAGWKGDYMLLAYKIPDKDLEWFFNKGILVKKCEPIFKDNELQKLCDNSPEDRSDEWPNIASSKFYLFTPEFKKWQNIIFLDADIIVRAPLDELTKVKGFSASYNRDFRLNTEFSEKHQITTKDQQALYQKLKNSFNLKEKAFNSGVMAFNTQIIQEDTFSKLNSLFLSYNSIHSNGDQPTFNLFFCKKWQHLPRVYNTYANMINAHNSLFKPKGIILHIFGRREGRPWFPENYYYAEWKNNLKKAENIDISKPTANIKTWSKIKIWIYSFPIYLKVVFYDTSRGVDKILGIVGLLLRKNNPKLYKMLKPYFPDKNI